MYAAMIRTLLQGSTRRTFTHQFRLIATRHAAPAGASRGRKARRGEAWRDLRKRRPKRIGLAAVKQQQRQRRGQSLRHLWRAAAKSRAPAIENEIMQPTHPRQGTGGPMSVFELYCYYLARGEAWKFFRMFPPTRG
jgi:hypothetical protein